MTLTDIINLEGVRSPAMPSAPKNFKPAFVVVSDPSDTASTIQAMTDKVRSFQNSFANFFSGITRGLATLELPLQNISYARYAEPLLAPTFNALKLPDILPAISKVGRPAYDLHWSKLGRPDPPALMQGKKKRKYRPWKKMG